MARLPRVVAPGLPQVTQRGNRRQRTFFADADYAEYCGLLTESCRSCGTEVLAYCQMPNHVPLILVPADELALRDALGEAHRRYIYSFVMDEQHLLVAARYVERTPVRARFLPPRAGLVRGRAPQPTLPGATMAWSLCERCWTWFPTGMNSLAKARTKASMSDCGATPAPAGRSASTPSSNPWSDASSAP